MSDILEFVRYMDLDQRKCLGYVLHDLQGIRLHESGDGIRLRLDALPLCLLKQIHDSCVVISGVLD